MFKKVVVGVDGFRDDRNAIAAALAIAPDAQLDLVTVYADGGAPLQEGDLDEYREIVRHDAEGRLAELRGKGELPAETAVHAVSDHSPSRGLRRHARESGADLIVLGASSKGSLGRALLGDFARGVLHGAPCPVLSVAHRHGAAVTTPGVIGVAYDSSREANQALDLAVDLARHLGARLEIVEAVEVGVIPPVWGIELGEYLDGLVGSEQERLEALAESLPVPATALATRGAVGHVLHRLAAQVDLMICGSAGWGEPGRIAFGSTADRLLHHAPCEVLVVPRGVEVDTDDEGGQSGPTERAVSGADQRR